MEYGGYIEIERAYGESYYPDLMGFNYCRNALVFLLRSKGIRKIYLPYYICDSVINAIKRYGIEISWYAINEFFLPCGLSQTDEHEAILIVNYYGFLSSEYQASLAKKYNNVIIDNSQAFFSAPPEGMDAIYSCRKFFGVSDGGLLASRFTDNLFLDQDKSSSRMDFLVGRLEDDAKTHYNEFRREEDKADKSLILRMSKLTEHFLRQIDYQAVKEIRSTNYSCLHSLIKKYNRLAEVKFPEGPYGYPLLADNGPALRNRLINRNIYVPWLWKNVLSTVEPDSIEAKFSNNLLLLPIDQRYTTEDMKIIANIIEEEIVHV